MKLMTMLSLTIIIILNLMMMMSILLSKKSFMDREKCSPFECGFDMKSSARSPFSLHFFLITLIFLIFDVEIVLILPMIMTFNLVNFKCWMMTSIFFFIILILGLYHEWNQNMLNWMN